MIRRNAKALLVLIAFAAIGPASARTAPAVRPDNPAPHVVPVPRADVVPLPPPVDTEAPPAPPAEQSDMPAPPLPRSGRGAVVLEPGQSAVDITGAVGLYLPPASDDAPGFASYLLDLVNRGPRAQTRILVLDTGVYGGRGAPLDLNPSALESVLTSMTAARADILEGGPRTKIRIEIPAGQTVTAAFRFDAPLHNLTVEMWDEAAFSRFETASRLMEGVLLGLITALGAWLCGIALLRRDRRAGWLALLFGSAFLALLTGFGFAGPFGIDGVLTSPGLALGVLALGGAIAFGFVVQALVPEGRWRGFGVVAEYGPWLVGAAAGAALLNAPYAAVVAKSAVLLSLLMVVAVIFARAWEGDRAARRLTLAAIFVLMALAPLVMLETVEGGGHVTMLTASGLFGAALLLAAFAISAGAPPALRQRVDHVTGYGATAFVAPPPFAAPLPSPPGPVVFDDSRYSLALAAAHQGLWDWDLKRDRLFLSPSVEALLGARPGELQTDERDWREHIHSDDLATFLGALDDYRRLGDVSFVLDFRGRGFDGVERWLRLRASFMSDGVKAARCIGLVSDVSGQKESEANLLASARQDPVTDLANRSYFLDVITHRTAFASPARRYALALFDIARFRTINDGIGHAAGDLLLRSLADRLRAVAPENALCARLGDDIFGMLWIAHSPDDAAETVKSALDACAVPLDIADRRIAPLMRGGLVLIDGQGRDAAGVIGDAEAALDQARLRGGDLSVFVPAMGDEKAGRARLERDLVGAVERGEMLVFYQPIVRVMDRRPAGFEALLRWRHPERGLLAAEHFAPLAEETGLIEPLGRFALETAARDAARWRRIAPFEPPLFMNVNVSASQLASPGFLALCERIAADGLAERGSLHLEITETLAIRDTVAATAALQRLRAAGFGLVMDDFGAGHSTLGRLAAMPFNAVKIDRSFLLTGGASRTMLAGLIRLSRDLGLEATVEGVEAEEDFTLLAANGCSYAQGYYCGVPRDAGTIQAYLLDAEMVAEAGE